MVMMTAREFMEQVRYASSKRSLALRRRRDMFIGNAKHIHAHYDAADDETYLYDRKAHQRLAMQRRDRGEHEAVDALGCAEDNNEDAMELYRDGL
jgi:hypothetical protein